MWPIFFLIVLEESDWISDFKPAKALVGLVAWSDLDIYLGKMSYSAYLQHIPLFSSVVGSAGLMLGGEMSQLLATTLVILSTLAMIPLSHVAYNVIEAPFSRVDSQFAKRLPRLSRV